MKTKLFFIFSILLCFNGYSQQAVPQRVPAQPVQIPENVKIIRDIEYGNVEGHSLLMDIYIPETGEVPVPLVVWMHGGGWQTGSKENCRAAMMLLKYGFAIASINYRLTSIAVFPAQIEDCKSAVRFLRANASLYNIDPEKIGAWGQSAGGHLASLLGTTADVKDFDRGDYLEFSSKVQAVCNYYGPSLFAEMPFLQVIVKLLGGEPELNPELAARASPLTYVSGDSSPFFIIFGDRDKVVPVSQGEKLYRALLEKGVEAQLHVIKDAGHGGPPFTSPELIEKAASFFSRHLKKGASDDGDISGTEK